MASPLDDRITRLRQQSADRANAKAAQREAEREANRRDFAELLEEQAKLERFFGAGVKITYATNGTRTVGKTLEEQFPGGTLVHFSDPPKRVKRA